MFRRMTNYPSTIVGIFLLMILSLFAGPNALPRVISSLVPFIDEGVPCGNLRTADDRDRHQSIIGRIASTRAAPLSLRVEPDDIPNDPSALMMIRIVITNETIGTVPIVYPGEIQVNNSTVSGLGIILDNQAIQPVAQQPLLVPDSNIRLLLPRQRCVERIYVQAGTVQPNTRVTAFYRNSSSGSFAGRPNAIFPDQGLWIGLQTSPAVELRRAPIP